MRAAGSAVYFADTGRPEADARSTTMDAARRIAALPHGDRAGFEAIPSRWTGPLHVPLPGCGGRVPRTPDLVTMAGRLDGRRLDEGPADMHLP